MDTKTKEIIKDLIQRNELLTEALTDCSGALEYIRMQQGDLPGVSYDRALEKAKSALAA